MSKHVASCVIFTLFAVLNAAMILFLIVLALDHTDTFLTLIMYAIGYNVSKALYTATDTLEKDIKRGDEE